MQVHRAVQQMMWETEITERSKLARTKAAQMKIK